MAELRAADGLGARALQLTVLTAARSGEILNACWSEFDLDNAIWTVPPELMKAGREHRVPLAPAAVALLESLLPIRDVDAGDWLFPGSVKDAPSRTWRWRWCYVAWAGET
jgi:integrase